MAPTAITGSPAPAITTGASSTLTIKASDRAEILADAGGASVAIDFGQGAGAQVSVGAAIALNDVANSVTAIIDSTRIDAAGHVEVLAESRTLIDVFTFGFAGTLKGGQGLNFAFDLAGSGSINKIGGTTLASITSSVVDADGDVTVSSTDEATIEADAGGVALALSFGKGASFTLAIAVSVALNEISHTTRATVASATVSADRIAVLATSVAEISALTIAGSGDFGGGSGFSGGLGGAGAGSKNTVANIVEALVSASTLAAGAGQVTVTASEAGKELFTLTASLAAQLDDLALTGDAVDTANDAAALAAVQAAFLGHGVTLSNATQIAVLDTVQSLDGTGNIVLNTTTRWLARDPGGQTFVLVRDGSLLRVLRPALVSADAGGIGVAINIRGSGAGSVAIGAAVGLNEVTNTVRAAIESSTVSATAGVTVSAISGVTIDVLTIGIALGIAGGQTGGISLAGAGSGSGNTIGSSATATISGGSVTTAGPVAVSAADSSRIRADAGAAAISVAGGGTGGGALAVGGSLAVGTISTTARALLDGTTLGSPVARVGAVTVSASSSA